MAEVKNAFIKSKMNKDLDARLVPSGEYRDANNVQVSRSEGSDVGALENVLGNIEVADFESNEDLSCIGYYADESTDFIYLFLTDNSDSSLNYTPTGVGSNNYIYRFNSFNNTKTKLASGAFLNFSKAYPITGVNVLENLLFWTDNRNQPRKINLNKAASDNEFYNNEDKVSVVKYNPWQPILLYKESVDSTGDYETTMKDVVSKFLPNGGKAKIDITNTGTTFSISDLFIPFYPVLSNNENSNLPKNGMTLGKINSSGDLEDTGVTVSTGSTATSLVVSSSITLNANDEIIFNFNPYYDNDYDGDDSFFKDKFVRFSYRFKFADGENSLIAPFTQPVFIPEQDGYFLNNSKDTGDQHQTFNSTIVDFMQNKVNKVDLQIQLPTSVNLLASDYDINSIDIIYKESDATSMQVVETIDITQESSSDTYYEYTYKAQKPYRTLPSNEITRVYDKAPVRALSQEIVSNRVIYGNYVNKHTPPDFINYSVLVRDKFSFNLQNGTANVNGAVNNSTTVVIDAADGVIQVGSLMFGTDVTEGAVVVSFTGTKPNLTLTLNENQTISDNTDLTFTAPSSDQHYTSLVEYPSSSLKTNRNYQVGLILSDRYGRSSTVILNNGSSTVYVPYEQQVIGSNPVNWLGNALRLSFNDPIDGSTTGIYNGDTTSSAYNPLGWYSYKIVVKQLEQDYYNVYTAGAIKGDPFYETTEPINQNTSYITLLNDNINKVPRDLSEVGPQDKTFRSSVRLFGRVENTQALITQQDNYSNRGNVQYYPDTRFFTTNNIEDLFDLFDTNQFEDNNNKVIPVVNIKNPYYAFFKAESNPFVGEFVTSNTKDNQFGVVNLEALQNQDFSKVNNLAIFETAPTLSRIDIFYETSTAGLISDLNNAVLNSSNSSSGFGDIVTSDFLESLTANQDITDNFFLVNTFGSNIEGSDVTTPLTLISVVNGSGIDVTNYFNLVGNQTSGFNIQTTSFFTDGGSSQNQPSIYYSTDANLRQFTFNFSVAVNEVSTTPNFSLDLVNVQPEISGCPAQTVEEITNDIITTLTAVNGASSNNVNRASDITWSIASITKDGEAFTNDPQIFDINTFNETPSRCQLVTVSTVPGNTFVITVQAEDAGGLVDSCAITLDIGVIPASMQERYYQFRCQGESQDDREYYFVIEVINEGDNNGFYIISKRSRDIGSPGEILIDNPTDAINSSQDACTKSNWYYGETRQAAENLFISCESCTNTGFTRFVQNLDISNYTFKII